MNEFFVIGVVGYCFPTKFDKEEAWSLLSGSLQKMASKKDKQQKILILGGLTDISSIHQLSYYYAKQQNWNIGGIACEKANDFKWFPMSNWGDMLYITGEKWGDESAEFINRCDALIRIGGGKQSQNEIELAKQKGIPIEEMELK